MSSKNKTDNQYFAKCFFAGLFPCGLTHTLLTPIDVVKCRMQIYPNEYPNLITGFKTMLKTDGFRSLYLGWQPTILGYSLQGATKYGFYEIFKSQFQKIFGQSNYDRHRTLCYLTSSAFAEMIADCILCPFESLKVRMQTSLPGTFPTKLMPAYDLLKQEGSHGFYKGLVPLIFRQVPNTMVKFATYENSVKFFYTHVFTKNKNEYNKMTQLLVTFLSGYIAGTFCCIVSNPADIVVSKINNMKTDRSVSLSTTVRNIYMEVGISGLWRGVFTRILMVGTLSGLEWLIYDFFKLISGLSTTGHK